LIPDIGDAVGEVHVVGEEWLARGGVGSGDDPVVGAGEAAFADGVAESLLEGEEVCGGCGECGPGEFGLGFVERDIGYVFLRGGEIDDGLCGRMVAPGDGGVEIADEVWREFGGESFAVQFGGEAGGEVLKHDEADEEAVAWGPGCGLITEETEFEREVGALKFHGGVDAGGVALEEVELVGGKSADGAVCGCADEEGALKTIVSEERGAEDFSEGA